ncbi:MAG: Dam family site-specific DNA-(adenine-N6)-methyltransferase [Chloroflexales bacterium]
MKIYVPPIKCQGIKTKLVQWIKAHADLPSGGRWIEPFMGSGVVGFNLRPHAAIFADVNPHIVNFYNAMKHGQVTAARAKAFLEKEGALLTQKGEAHYYALRDRFNEGGDPFDFLFLSRACFNGLIRFNKKGRYNVPFGHKPRRFAQAYVTKIANQIRYVESAIQQYDWSFVCADFRAVMREAGERDFLYCDPPYMGRHADYYSAWSDREEEALYQHLSTMPTPFMLSTWHSNRYRRNTTLDRYASQFTVFTREHFYHVGPSEDHRHAMLEAIVLNYVPVALDHA